MKKTQKWNKTIRLLSNNKNGRVEEFNLNNPKAFFKFNSSKVTFTDSPYVVNSRNSELPSSYISSSSHFKNSTSFKEQSENAPYIDESLGSNKKYSTNDTNNKTRPFLEKSIEDKIKSKDKKNLLLLRGSKKNEAVPILNLNDTEKSLDLNSKDPLIYRHRRSNILSKILEDSQINFTKTDYSQPKSFHRREKQRETIRFFNLLATENKNLENKNSAVNSKERKESLFLQNQLRKLNPIEKKVEKMKNPVFKSVTQLNRFLLREIKDLGVATPEVPEVVKRKERIVEESMKEVDKIKANSLKRKEKEMEFEGIYEEKGRKRTKKSTRITKKDTLDNARNDQALDLDMYEYETLDPNTAEVNENNLLKVIKFLSASRATRKGSGENEISREIRKGIKKNFLPREYKIQKLLKHFSPARWLKTSLRPSTIQRFNAMNGNYFGFS